MLSLICNRGRQITGRGRIVRSIALCSLFGKLPKYANKITLKVNFFEFYGRKLNIWDVGVSCQGSGAFFSKNSKGFVNKDRPFLLSIEDPQATTLGGTPLIA